MAEQIPVEELNLWRISFRIDCGERFCVFSFFGRSSGSESAPSFNLAADAVEGEDRLRRNEQAALSALGVKSLYLPKQIHGNAVARIPDSPELGVTRGGPADAAIADRPECAVGILTADCVPILIADRKGRAAAAVHAGWRGLSASIIEAAICELAEMNIPASDLTAIIGPAIGPCCYEVDSDLAEKFRREVPGGENAIGSRGAKPTIDLPAVAREQLISFAGLNVDSVRVLRRCTACETGIFFSHRREEGRTGRQLSAVLLQENCY